MLTTPLNVYFISGLGADASVFRHIKLPPFCTPVYLDWLPPQSNEILPHYAVRMGEAIDQSKPFALIGLSFGGMIAAELAQQTTPVCTILISSVPHIKHLPLYFTWAGRVRLHQVVPIRLLKTGAVIKRFFTNEKSDDKQLLRRMIQRSDPQFLRWAMHAVLTWKCNATPNELIHIHGTKDVILPMRFTKPTHIIKGGGHLMVFTRAAEINEVLDAVLTEAVQANAST